MMTEKTGYSSIDKPWSVLYQRDALQIDVEDTLYNTFRKIALLHLDEIALLVEESNETYTYGEILNLVDKTASAFVQMGIGVGSRIGAMFNGSIEEPVTLLASNKIGAVLFFVDYFKGADGVLATIAKSNFDLLIMDQIYALADGGLNPEISTILCNTDTQTFEGNVVSFKQMLDRYQGVDCDAVPYSRDKKSVVIYSSGTTGAPKPIVHTDFSINCAAQKVFYSNFPLNDRSILLKTIPSFIGLGLITSLYTGLISGAKVALISGSNPKDSVDSTVRFIEHYKDILSKCDLPPDMGLVIFSAPIFYRAILYTAKLTDLSFVKGILAAGAKMDEDELAELDGILERLGCTCQICNGYGQNEMAGAITLNDNRSNVRGSGGYPTFGTEISIVDPKTLEYLGNNRIGKILEKSVSAFAEYLDMPERTEQSFITLPDGSKWFDTNDLGYMSDDYHLFITGRTSRVVIRMDCKIPLDGIENKLRQIDGIKDCAILVTSQGKSYEAITAYVELSGTEVLDRDSLKRVIDNCQLLSEFEHPDDVVIVDKIPYLGSGKVDYESIKKQFSDAI